MNYEKISDRYNYYAEQMTQFMANSGLIQDDEAGEFEYFIRGCA